MGQMIKALINFMGLDGDDLLLDPFVGSGTTLIEATTLSVLSVGIDINPALCIVSQIKLDALTINYPELQEGLSKIEPLTIFLIPYDYKGLSGFGGLRTLIVMLRSCWRRFGTGAFLRVLSKKPQNLGGI